MFVVVFWHPYWSNKDISSWHHWHHCRYRGVTETLLSFWLHLWFSQKKAARFSALMIKMGFYISCDKLKVILLFLHQFHFSYSHILEEILQNELHHRLSPTFPSRGKNLHFISAFRARLQGKVVNLFEAPAVISSYAQIRLLEPRGLIHLIKVPGQSYILYCVGVRVNRRISAGIDSAHIEYN